MGQIFQATFLGHISHIVAPPVDGVFELSNAAHGTAEHCMLVEAGIGKVEVVRTTRWHLVAEDNCVMIPSCTDEQSHVRVTSFMRGNEGIRWKNWHTSPMTSGLARDGKRKRS
jgi:hypothetical protein